MINITTILSAVCYVVFLAIVFGLLIQAIITFVKIVIDIIKNGLPEEEEDYTISQEELLAAEKWNKEK